MKNKILLLIFMSSLLLSACNSAKDALQGKTRAERSDEFLVEKKNPLSMPPDYEKLPKPLDDMNETLSSEKNQDLKAKLKIKSESPENNKPATNNNSLEKKIIEKINN